MSENMMQAQVLHAVGDMRYQRIPRPQPGPGQVLVRVAFCGICGSDLPRTFVKGAYRFPIVIGHEFAGTVAEPGPVVSGLAEGDPVAVFPLLWCGVCPACEQGKYAQCLNYGYLGSRNDGALAEFVLAPARNLLPVPDGVSLAAAAMTEPAAVALHALRRAGPLLGQTIAIFGAGPIGLMAAQWARLMGAGKVLVFDIVPQKLALARELGFDEAFHSRAVEAVRQVEEETGGQGAHVCIEAAGAPAATLQALTAARRGGRVVLLGNPSGDVTLPAGLISQFLRRELALLGTWNSDFSAAGNDDDWRAVLAAMASGSLDLEPLITHRVPLAHAFEALKMMRDQTDFYAKVLVDCT
ncbi:MAG: galactitol-1-phosphate 5-dehydrogenase [Caldilineales bacterium]|nr:galactitol-1-phosphate 5-dehydrogenase [Caldilineales bacterium]MCW5858885.1 galactitol-1-phosphate 5-dehydrogenase [Caldilineales bacterium]